MVHGTAKCDQQNLSCKKHAVKKMEIQNFNENSRVKEGWGTRANLC